jgi:hypothetical protein
MRTLLLATAVVTLFGVTLFSAAALAQQSDPAKEKKATADPTRAARAHRGDDDACLGIRLTRYRCGVARQLPDAALKGQGLRVARVAHDSPAEKAGIKAGDILLSYDDQKLFARNQLAGLVGADDPGDAVSLAVFRDGRQETVQVTLSESAGSQARHWFPGQRLAARIAERIENRRHDSDRFLSRLRDRQWFTARTEASDDHWKNFDSLTIKSLGDDRFQLDYQHRHEDGETASHSFEGTRAELRAEIMREDHLSADERGHLLRCLDLRSAMVATRARLLDRFDDGERAFSRFARLFVPKSRAL